MELDIKDKKILKELDINAKISTSKLAKNIRLSQQVVDYRIKKLEESGLINHFGTIINLAKLGYGRYKLLITLGNITDEEKEKLVKYLIEHKMVYWAALIGNKWDLLISIFTKNYNEFEEFLEELFSKFKNEIKDYEALYVLYHEFYNRKFLGSKEIKIIKLNNYNIENQVKIDKIDLCILDQIKNNARKSALEVSKECNTTYKTVQNRIENLIKYGIIEGFRVFLASSKLGYKPYLLLISFTNYGIEVEKKIIAFAKENEKITQSIKTFGKWSLIFHLRVKDYEELQNFIIKIRNKYPIIGDYEVIPLFGDISINHFPMSKKIIENL